MVLLYDCEKGFGRSFFCFICVLYLFPGNPHSRHNDVKLFAISERGLLESFIRTVQVSSTDIGMQFVFRKSKCAMLFMWRGKVTKTDGIRLPDDRVIKNLEKGKSYKFLGGTGKWSNMVRRKEIQRYKGIFPQNPKTSQVEAEWLECTTCCKYLCRVLSAIYCCVYRLVS